MGVAVTVGGRGRGLEHRHLVGQRRHRRRVRLIHRHRHRGRRPLRRMQANDIDAVHVHGAWISDQRTDALAFGYTYTTHAFDYMLLHQHTQNVTVTNTFDKH